MIRSRGGARTVFTGSNHSRRDPKHCPPSQPSIAMWLWRLVLTKNCNLCYNFLKPLINCRSISFDSSHRLEKVTDMRRAKEHTPGCFTRSRLCNRIVKQHRSRQWVVRLLQKVPMLPTKQLPTQRRSKPVHHVHARSRESAIIPFKIAGFPPNMSAVVLPIIQGRNV